MLTDTHCHLFNKDYDNIHDILNNLKEYNIKRIIINGCNHQTNQEVMKLVDQYDNVYGALGVHPSDVNDNIEENIKFIENNLNHPKIIAIGEIGLDYYWTKDNREKQINCFKQLLDLASKHRMPVIIHNREANGDMLNILNEYDLIGIMHCFTGDYELGIKYIKMGYKLGINGIVTFKNSNLSEIISKIDIKNILLETDAPYITPAPYRNQQNEPKYLNIISQKVAEIYGINEAKLAEILEQNFYDIFDFLETK